MIRSGTQPQLQVLLPKQAAAIHDWALVAKDPPAGESANRAFKHRGSQP